MQIELLDKTNIEDFSDYLIGMDDADLQNEDIYYLGAFLEEELCGVAAFNASAGRVDLVSICVAEEDQKKNIGISLIEELTKLAAEMDSELITATIDEDDVEDGVGQFLWKAGLTPTREVQLGRITIGDFLQKEMIKEFGDKIQGDSRIVSADEVPAGKLNEFLKSHKFGSVQRTINKKYSCVSLAGGEIESCALIGVEEGKVSLEGLVFSSNKLLSFGMLIKTFSELAKDYPLDTVVSYAAVNDKSQKVAETLNPGGEAINLYVYEMKLNDLGDDEGYEADDIERDYSQQSSFEETPGFYALKNCSLVCKDCRYCISGIDVMECHRFGTKPVEVLNGESCSKYSQIPMKESK